MVSPAAIGVLMADSLVVDTVLDSNGGVSTVGAADMMV